MDTCAECIKKYMLSNLEDPHCMHCKHPWEVDFINKNLSNNFLTKEYKKSRSELLFQREKSYFPDAMKQIEKNVTRKKLQDELKNLKQRIKDVQHELYLIDHNEEFIEEKSKNIRLCSFPNCKGYINEKGKCPICFHKTCMKCNTIKKDEHKCEEKDLQTWQLIEKSSKACPNCATRIQKSEGCAQMWCPGCHKAFNWNTGKIEKGPIHNPHYYEYTTRLGLNNEQYQFNNCNGIWYHTTYKINSRNLDQKSISYFINAHAHLNHIVHIELPNIQRKINRDNLELNMQYLQNKITEEKYKKILVTKEKQNQKNTRILAIYEATRFASETHLLQFKNYEISFEKFVELINNINLFIDESFKEINKIFKSKITPIKLI